MVLRLTETNFVDLMIIGKNENKICRLLAIACVRNCRAVLTYMDNW